LKHEKVVTRAVHELATQDAIERDLDRGFLSIPHAALWDAVETLGPDLRQVVELRYRQQRSYREIASELGLPVGTVGTRLMRAYDRLWQLLRLRAA
jgi:RNA polymerase sigma factor (sigma-70 family)